MEKLTAKEKAEELFVKFNKDGLYKISSIINRHIRKEIIKQCALIAVDEILNNFGRATEGKQHYTDYNTIEFYTKVKHEIEHL
jgi:hypothetical protein